MKYINLHIYPPEFYGITTKKDHRLRLLIHIDGRHYKVSIKRGYCYDEIFGDPRVRPERFMKVIADGLESGKLILSEQGLFEKGEVEIRENMIQKCYICGKIYGEKEPYEDKDFTHGLCDECFKSEMERLEIESEEYRKKK